MSDVDDRLRAADPEPDCPPPSIDLVWTKLEQNRTRRGRGPRQRRSTLVSRARSWLIPAVGLAVVGVIAAVALGVRHQTGSPSSGPSRGTLVEYRVTDVFRPSRSSGASFSAQRTTSHVWVSGQRGHSLATVRFTPPGGSFTHEIAVNGTRELNYQAGTIDQSTVTTGRACVYLVICAPGIPIDPAAAFGHLKATGAFRFTGYMTVDHRRLAAYVHNGSPHVRALVNPDTGVPTEVTVGYGNHPWPVDPTDTIVISDYRHEPLTTSKAKLLDMRPHPHACVPSVRPVTPSSRTCPPKSPPAR